MERTRNRKSSRAMLVGAVMAMLIACFALSATAQNAYADNGSADSGTGLLAAAVGTNAGDAITYLDEKGEEATCEDYKLVSELSDVTGVTLGKDGEFTWYYLDKDMTFSHRLTTDGSTYLILKDGCTLNAECGIRVVEGSKFYIYAQSTGNNMGVIKADNSDNAEQAGIGGNDDEDSGSIEINGGNITAEGGKYAAGIGGGDNGQGFVHINGGKVEATGGDYGAGIGSGDEAGEAGGVWINGGEINAKGGYDGAGIGGGNETAGGEIQINGGKKVEAKGGYFGAGIGGGDDGDAGKISISGGEVHACSGGVESGNSWVSSNVGGAGIGGGRHGNAGTIKISGGKIYADGMYRAAAIGSSGDSHHEYTGEHNDCDGGYIEISGGDIEAYPRNPNSSQKGEKAKNTHDGGSAIGSGADSYGVYVKITGGKIRVNKSYYTWTEYGSAFFGGGVSYWAEKYSACIGNGYSTDSKGKVEIVNTDKNPNLIIDVLGEQKIGESEYGDECDVIVNVPYCQINNALNNKIPKEKRAEYIRDGYVIPYTLRPCRHENTAYTSAESGHSGECKWCDYVAKDEEHEFEWLHDDKQHWQRCKDCKYETEKSDHEYDQVTGECIKCGHKGLKVELKQEGGSGDSRVLWVGTGYQLKLGNPEEYGFEALSGTSFRGWRFSDYKGLYPAGEGETVRSDLAITAVFGEGWFDFKDNVESLKDYSIKLENDIVVEKVDENAADEANEDLMITIPEGHNVTIDLNGHKINKNNRSRSVAEGESKTDLGIFAVKGTLTIKDSSEGGTGAISGGYAMSGTSISAPLDGNHGGAITVDGGKLTLESGTIATNIGDAGGAVYVSNGTFNMTGGTIRENMGGRATAVCVGPDGAFAMSGGTITENASLYTAGVPAVQIEGNGALTLGGKVEISNNRCVNEGYSDYAVSNICLKDGGKVAIADTLDPESKIGIGTDVQLIGDQKVQITSGNKVADVANFTSDNPGYQVVVENGEAYLQRRVSSNPDAEISYKITIPDNIRGGKVVLDKVEDVISGGVINILAVPDEGYGFSHWSIGESSPEGSVSHVTIPSGGGTKASTSLSFEYQFEGEDDLKELEVTIRPSFSKIIAEKIDLFLADSDGRSYIAPKTHIQAALGETLQLEAAISPDNAAQDVVWSSSDPEHVAIDENGKVTVKGPSQLPEITATSADGYAKTTIYLSIAAVNTVTFDSDGGEGANGEVYLSAGQKVAKPDDPVRGGEKFLGWKKVLEDGSLDGDFYDFDSIVESSFTLKAAWDHKAHTLAHVEAVAATCDQDGHDEYWECSVCKHVFIDAEGEDEVSLANLTTSADHKWGVWTPVKDAEGEATNYHQRICENDGSHVEKEKHNWDSGVSVVAPTTESDGQAKYTCDTCGETKIVTVPKLEEDEHSITITTEVEGNKDAVGGTVAGGKSKGKKGETYKLKPKARNGYEFMHWLIGGMKIQDESYGLTVGDSDIALTAVFAEVAVERVEVFDGGVFLSSGETYSLYEKIKIYPWNALMPGLAWESSDAKVATVNENGVVTAVSKGTAVIAGKRGDGTQLATITVHVDIDPDNPDDSVNPDKPSTDTDVKVGSSHQVGGSTYTVTGAGTVALSKAKNAKSVSVPASVKIQGKEFKVTEIGAKAFAGKKIRTVTIGKNVKTIKAKAFKGSKATKLIVKSKKLTKKSVKGSLKGSKIKTVKVKVGKKKVNKKYVKKYKKIFTKKNAGKKVSVK